MTLLQTYRRLRGRTGCVGRDALSAWELAKARHAAQEAGCSWNWEDDPDPDLSWLRPGESVREVLYCAILDAEGNPLASIGGVADPDDFYRLLLEANLALEASAAFTSAYAI